MGATGSGRQWPGFIRGPDNVGAREFAALKREVKTLRLEREILKKAAAFFAKETT